ncbi:hypothetical protein [Rhizobium sp. C4]|uniref:hypothetical protein n=1 Tax=Rhizobium sp. C4 TaxID=1349800 RepID=UPI001E347794|nr:hypothetical protein [Rhizobium sp. C4]MCD2172730.1 hypothetical protein [Rhizobium sp. C4]
MGDALSACRNLKPRRWAAASLCILLGLSAASLMGWQNAPKSAPAQVVAFSGNDGSSVVAPAEAVAQMRKGILAPASLLKTSAELNLAESGFFGDRKAEDVLAAAIEIAPSDRASVIDIKVNSGAPAFDALIANHIARSLTAQPIAQAKATPPASAEPIGFTLVSKARVIPAGSVLLYQAELVILSLLMAASVVALGVARELRTRSEPVDMPARPTAVVPRGILEQIDMLERMWPETGRQNSMPEGSNDEPEQFELKPARDIVVRMAELRLDARKAMQQPSEEALEDVLTDMQSLRDQVRFITAEQLRRRRKVNAFGR